MGKSEVTQMLTREAASCLFRAYAFYVHHADVIPKETAIQLLGEDAVAFAVGKQKSGADRGIYNAYGIGEPGMLYYLTYHGFMVAVTAHNVALAIRQSEEGTP